MKKAFFPGRSEYLHLNLQKWKCIPPLFLIFLFSPGMPLEKKRRRRTNNLSIFQFSHIQGGIEAKCHTIGREVFLARSLLFFPWIFRDFLVK